MKLISMQLKLSKEFRSRSDFGGELGVGKRKERRPISTKKAMHTVLRSYYRGLRKFKRPLAILLEAQSKKWAVTLYKYSINSNHIHPPFSRIIEWGRAYKGALNYILKNQLEAAGVISYTPRVGATSSPPSVSRVGLPIL
jgi:hypothetical protein